LHWHEQLQRIEHSRKNKSIADPLKNLQEVAGNKPSRPREFSNRSEQLSFIDNTLSYNELY